MDQLFSCQEAFGEIFHVTEHLYDMFSSRKIEVRANAIKSCNSIHPSLYHLIAGEACESVEGVYLYFETFVSLLGICPRVIYMCIYFLIMM